MHAELARSLVRNYRHLLEAANVETLLETQADLETITALAPDAVVVATGARPHEPDFPHGGIEVVQAFDVLRGPPPRGRRVVIADWGGDASGLARADLLEAAGNDVTVAVGSAALGETLHAYRRNLLRRPASTAPESSSPTTWSSLAPTGAGCASGTSSRPSWSRDFAADLLVVALGRIPTGRSQRRWRRPASRCTRPGIAASPRGLEEAILEGTLAGQSV